MLMGEISQAVVVSKASDAKRLLADECRNCMECRKGLHLKIMIELSKKRGQRNLMRMIKIFREQIRPQKVSKMKKKSKY